jgi:hypothetical protein
MRKKRDAEGTKTKILECTENIFADKKKSGKAGNKKYLLFLK